MVVAERQAEILGHARADGDAVAVVEAVERAELDVVWRCPAACADRRRECRGPARRLPEVDGPLASACPSISGIA